MAIFASRIFSESMVRRQCYGTEMAKVTSLRRTLVPSH